VAETLHRQRRAGGRTQGRIRRVDLALRIDGEGAVFLDDPPIILDFPESLRVEDLDSEVACRLEGQIDCGSGTRRILGIPGLVSEGVAAATRRRGCKGAVRVEEDVESSTYVGEARRIGRQGQAAGVYIVLQH